MTAASILYRSANTLLNPHKMLVVYGLIHKNAHESSPQSLRLYLAKAEYLPDGDPF